MKTGNYSELKNPMMYLSAASTNINAIILPTSLNVHTNMAFHRTTLVFHAPHLVDAQHA
jgi:hypothetical protein